MRALGRIEKRGRSAAVHHDLACDHAHAPALGRREQGFGAFGMGRAEEGAAGRAVAQQLVENEVGRDPADLGIMEAALLGERVALQPFEQRRPVARDHTGLRHVQVRVDQARNDEVRSTIRDGQAGLFGEQIGRVADGRNQPVLDHDKAVLLVARSPLVGWGVEAQEAAAQCVAAHCAIMVGR